MFNNIFSKLAVNVSKKGNCCQNRFPKRKRVY